MFNHTPNPQRSGLKVASKLRNAAIVLGLCATLGAASLGVGQAAEARVPKTATGVDATICRGLQGTFDQLMKEYYTPGKTAQQKQDIEDALHNAMRDWNHLCKADYGSIFFRVVTGATDEFTVANTDSAGVLRAEPVVTKAPVGSTRDVRLAQ